MYLEETTLASDLFHMERNECVYAHVNTILAVFAMEIVIIEL